MDLVKKKPKSRKHLAKCLKSYLVEGPEQTPRRNMIGDNSTPTSVERQTACKNYEITVTEIYCGTSKDEHWNFPISVMSLLYGETRLEELFNRFRPKQVQNKTPICTWIHIPENNVSERDTLRIFADLL